MDKTDPAWGTFWGVQRSIRYHARREAFFDRWHRLTAALSLLFATAAMADLLRGAGHWGAVAAAVLIAALSAVDLVVGTANMARKHADLRRRFIELERRMNKGNGDCTAWKDARLEIEADEPPIYVALDLMCENELAQASAVQRRFRVSGWQRFTAHWLHWANLQAVAV